ncbi:hypothetical protein PP178_04280 [Zeaxanthinibacter sp. PT1]|uniref:hypothetical protein n=1 Tax=Zeaxanthinibacter TaxID=561554 RepID=UPI002349DA17|nr:hypothetical protein [Zeaxanthinibacter sp. PT1]MDC6350757.1 hypothetical protein [Zeaxanthinibacter sp. PT1]
MNEVSLTELRAARDECKMKLKDLNEYRDTTLQYHYREMQHYLEQRAHKIAMMQGTQITDEYLERFCSEVELNKWRKMHTRISKEIEEHTFWDTKLQSAEKLIKHFINNYIS